MIRGGSIIIFALFLAACGSSQGSLPGAAATSNTTNPAGNPAVSGTKKWTYMVYLAADNSLSGAGVKDLSEMAQVGSSADVNIVVQAEFSATYTPSEYTAKTQRIYVQQGTTPGAAYSIGQNVNMASPQALTDFITWAKTNYPAQHYALVIWDHGAGWKKTRGKPGQLFRGAVEDGTSGSFMTLADLSKGVSDAGVTFDIINFDACLMGMYEVMYEFKGLASYFVASEELEPGDGDPYDTILADLVGNPNMTGAELAAAIVNRYNAFYIADNAANGNRNATTKSAVDMSKAAAVDAAVLALGAALAADANSSSAVASAQSSAIAYGYPANHDLYALADSLSASPVLGTAAKSAAADVKTAVTAAVIANKTTDSDTQTMSSSKGIAIYMPKTTETTNAELAAYGALKVNAARGSAAGTWGAYVEAFITANGGTALSTAAGDFALKVAWTKPDGGACDADIDLYVYEPDATGSGGSWYAPWMGTTTPNGFFSADSGNSGVSEEYYIAASTVTSGTYYFMINYYMDGAGCSSALAEILIQDVPNGVTTWTSQGTKTMGLSNALPSSTSCATVDCYNSYSDYWAPGYFVRGMLPELFSVDGNTLTIGRGNALPSGKKKHYVLLPINVK